MIEIGIKGRQEMTVTSANVATNVGSGKVKVFATPMMIALMEKASVLSIEPCLEEGQSSVGTHINVSRRIIAAITVVLVLVLVSCGNHSRLTKEEVIDYGEIGFSDIVSYIVVGYQSHWEDMDPYEMKLSGVYRYCSPYCGFCQKDINGDGIPELLIGDKFEDVSAVLYDIYTIHPKTASLIHLASGGERDRFTVSESGTIIEEGSNSASDSFTKAYRIKKGKLVELKAVTLEECPMDIDITTFESLAAKASQPCGGYSEVREPDMDEYQFFHEVTDTVKGMTFTPLTVQTQVVAGINYKFYCRYSDVTEEDNPGHCYLTIYKPLPGQGEPTITSIEKLK